MVPRLTPAQQEQLKKEQESDDELVARLQPIVPKFRLPPEPAPTTHYESWVPYWHVSANQEENVLNFQTRYYLSATSKQPAGHAKVELLVDVKRLGLNELETNRLVAVAGSKYNYVTGKLKLVSQKYNERFRNKAFLRETLNALLKDARENAVSHSETPDHALPLAARRGTDICNVQRKKAHSIR